MLHKESTSHDHHDHEEQLGGPAADHHRHDRLLSCRRRVRKGKEKRTSDLEEETTTTVLLLMIRRLSELPRDLLLVILLKLPVDALARLKCSCKRLYEMISDPEFIDMHLNRALEDPGNLYLFSSIEPYACYMQNISSDQFDSSGIKVSLERLVGKADAFWHWYKTAGGLIAYRDNTKSDTCFHIINPITREKVRVPSGAPRQTYPDDEVYMTCTAFGYSRSTREYKLVQFVYGIEKKPKGGLYTLGSRKWRDIDDDDIPFQPINKGYAECNGTFYWLAYKADDDYLLPEPATIIGSYDFESETFGCLQGPLPVEEGKGRSCYLADMGDKLACVWEKDTMSYSIWVLGDKVSGEWVKEYEVIIKIPDDLANTRRCVFSGMCGANGTQMFGFVCLRGQDIHACLIFDVRRRELKVIKIPSTTTTDLRRHKKEKERKRKDKALFLFMNYEPDDTIWLQGVVFSHAASLISPKKIMAEEIRDLRDQEALAPLKARFYPLEFSCFGITRHPFDHWYCSL